jgi:2-polyprenyl-3-methyl-5-hydroxy-6-metoxy-1,4-benzoquinol methylase
MSYDFRATACPADPLAHLFEDWVRYYQLKAAIAAVLQPKSILEIGVRYGYSAAAFLHGSPSASYLGIDIDADSFGGHHNAIAWAKKILAGSRAEFLVADSQTMTRFPGTVYDLIHIDGQQDGDGTYHDLELAVQQGRYVLVDGYFWTTTNFASVNEFLMRHKDAIEFYSVVPGYAGELLIKTEPRLVGQSQRSSSDANDGEALRRVYTSECYLSDCGGWDSFLKHHGRQVTDCRLGSVLDLAFQDSPGRLLDLGCGRGELTYAAASRGIRVSALDYSPSAIEIARSVFHKGEPAATLVEWLSSGATAAPLTGTYDVAVASDLVEHMTPADLEQMYAAVARHLSPRGRFIVHTYPNLWYYQYDYSRRRRVAASVGAYLPREPRSRYEKLMHINEQSPRVLRRQLQRHFPHVLLWFAAPEEPAGSLGRRFTRRELAAARDLYVIASHQPIAAQQMAGLLRTSPISAEEARHVGVEVLDSPETWPAGSEFEIGVRVVNNSSTPLGSYPPFPVHIAYHWLDAQTGAVVLFDGERTRILPSLPAASARDFRAAVKTPPKSGIFQLQVRLVQEQVRWFEECENAAASEQTVHVS